MRLLVSVRDIAEARIAAHGGAGFIDLKEPREGALGGLPPAMVRAIVDALRSDGVAIPISATIGDRALGDLDGIASSVDAVGACGVDYVKVGIDADDASVPAARAVLAMLACARWPIVPVFLADRGVAPELVAQAAGLGFPALMVDTVDKQSGSLFDVMSMAALRAFIRLARSQGGMAGLAGALRVRHAPHLATLAPDFAGFRSAVCAGDRTAALDGARLAELAQRMSRCSDVRPLDTTPEPA